VIFNRVIEFDVAFLDWLLYNKDEIIYSSLLISVLEGLRKVVREKLSRSWVKVAR